MKERKRLQHFGFLAEKQYCSDGPSRRSACGDVHPDRGACVNVASSSTLPSTPALICRKNIFQKYITNVTTNYFTSFIISLLHPGCTNLSYIFNLICQKKCYRSGYQFLSSPLHTRPGSNVNAKPFVPISQEKARHL